MKIKKKIILICQLFKYIFYFHRIADTLESSCNFVFLPQLMSCALTFCFQGFAIATVKIKKI